MAKLNNIYMTRFKDGWLFDEVVGKKKELFKILNLPLPTSEKVNEECDGFVEQDELADVEEIAAETAGIDITDL